MTDNVTHLDPPKKDWETLLLEIHEKLTRIEERQLFIMKKIKLDATGENSPAPEPESKRLKVLTKERKDFVLDKVRATSVGNSYKFELMAGEDANQVCRLIYRILRKENIFVKTHFDDGTYASFIRLLRPPKGQQS